MPGGRFQAPLDQECLNCLTRTDSVLSPEQSRQSNPEGRSEERSEASEPADLRPPSRSGAKEVRMTQEPGIHGPYHYYNPCLCPSLVRSWPLHCFPMLN